MRTVGYPHSEWDVINGLGPTRISPTYGLLNADGSGLVSYLGEQGIQAHNNPNASWQEVKEAAGFQPMVIGGRYWCHWVAVRIPIPRRPPEFYAPGLVLMNPSPGYMGVWQSLSEDQFNQLGEFSAVWLSAW
jgi:hypothetical protein